MTREYYFPRPSGKPECLEIIKITLTPSGELKFLEVLEYRDGGIASTIVNEDKCLMVYEDLVRAAIIRHFEILQESAELSLRDRLYSGKSE